MFQLPIPDFVKLVAKFNEESVALYGSRGVAYGAGHPLLYTQFQLNLVHEKRDQIILLKVGSRYCYYKHENLCRYKT